MQSPAQTQAQTPAQMPAQMPVQTPAQLKDHAAQFFKKGQFRAAIDLYTRADQLSEQTKFKAVVNNNIAVCYNQLLQPALAEPFSSKSIELDKGYIKAYLTRISSNEKLQKFQSCLKDYEQVLKMEDRAQWRKSYQQMKAKAQADLQKKKSEVIGGLKDMANGVLGWFNMSLDNFKVEQNQGGSYNISFKQ